MTILPPFTCSVPLLRSLHWLPVKFKSEFKICLLTYKTLHWKQPVYPQSMLATSLPSCSLRAKTNTGARTFRACTPSLWNNLPLSVHSATADASFGRHLKRHLFDLTFLQRHQDTRWPIDVMELLHQFCRWTLIWLLRHWAWLQQGYWRYRNMIGWLIDLKIVHSRYIYQTKSTLDFDLDSQYGQIKLQVGRCNHQ